MRKDRAAEAKWFVFEHHERKLRLTSTNKQQRREFTLELVDCKPQRPETETKFEFHTKLPHLFVRHKWFSVAGSAYYPCLQNYTLSVTYHCNAVGVFIESFVCLAQSDCYRSIMSPLGVGGRTEQEPNT